MGRYTAFYGIFVVGYLFGGISMILIRARNEGHHGNSR